MKNKYKTILPILYLLLVFLIGILILLFISIGYDFMTNIKEAKASTSISESVADMYRHKLVYIDELHRKCEKINPNLYYDPTTNCYFKFDIEKCPSQWTYYYVGFSDNYDDPYGWMTYQKYNSRWTINVAKQEWEIIDSNTEINNGFWHFKNAYKNTLE